MKHMDITGAPQVATASGNRAGWTVTFAVLAVAITPFALLTATGLLTPIGILAGLVAVSLATLVLVRTRKGFWPRRVAWALVVFSLLPWALTVAFLVTITFFDQLPSSSP
jgi:hypothetical protein